MPASPIRGRQSVHSTHISICRGSEYRRTKRCDRGTTMPRRRRIRQQAYTPLRQDNAGVVHWDGNSLGDQEQDVSYYEESSMQRSGHERGQGQSSNSYHQIEYDGNNREESISSGFEQSGFVGYQERAQHYPSYAVDSQSRSSLPIQQLSSYASYIPTNVSTRGRNYVRSRNRGGSSSRSRSRSKSGTGSGGTHTVSVSSEVLSSVGNRAIALYRNASSGEGEYSEYHVSSVALSRSEDTTDNNSETSSAYTCIPVQTTQMPQNLRGDPFRSAKIKTELCRNYMSGKGCLFGNKCNYAHGVEELKYTTLLALEDAGLVDVHTYRTHPCPTWISTGSCPFDLRCPFLHDPHVSSKHVSWLPHAETSVNSIDTDVNVDRLYHQRASDIFSKTPFQDFEVARNWKLNDVGNKSSWTSFYKFICNIDWNSEVQFPKEWSQIKTGEVSELHRLAIAYKMHKRKIGASYVYFPTHVIFGELCMILQSRAFQIIDNPIQLHRELVNLTEIELPSSHKHCLESNEVNAFDIGYGNGLVIAHEIVFGPVADPNARQISVCFNIPTNKIYKCSPQQAKRYKRSRNRAQRLLHKERAYAPPLSSKDKRESNAIPSKNNEGSDSFDSQPIPPFFENQPRDSDAFDLVSDIMLFRVRMLMNNNYPGLCLDESLYQEELELNHRFQSQMRFWMTWSWPFCNGRDKVNAETQIPPVNGMYSFAPHRGNFPGRELEISKTIDYSKFATGFLWISFLVNFSKNPQDVLEDNRGDRNMIAYVDQYKSLRRLPILRDLSLGKSQSAAPLLSPNKALLTPISSLSKSFKSIPDEHVARHIIRSFQDLFKFFSIVRTHYSLRNSSLDEYDGNEGEKNFEHSLFIKETNALLDDARSWTRTSSKSVQ